MGIQINLKLSDKMIEAAKLMAEKKGHDSLQDFIRETLREKLFEEVNSYNSYLASEESLARFWLRKEEDEAWQHLQKEI